MTKKAAPKKKPGSQADGVRGTLWYFAPNELTIVGHDTDEQEHELCHHASNAFAAERYEEYINYMRLHGVVKPIVFRRDGDRVLVVDGRTTTRVARVVAPLWEQDRKAEGLKGDDCRLRIPGVVRKGTADELFCASRAANRRRPEDSPVEQAKDVARLVNNGSTEEQAAVRLGISAARAKQLMAVLSLHPKVQRQVGAGLSLDAAAKLAKLPELDQVKRLDEFKAQGEKPTARAVTNKLREGSGKAPAETPAKRIASALQALDVLSKILPELSDDPATLRDAAERIIERITAILRPPMPNRAAQHAADEAGFGA